MSNGRIYTLKDLQDAKRIGIQEGIEQAQGVVLDMDREAIETMEFFSRIDEPEKAERWREMHNIVWMVYQDLIVLGDKVK